MIYIIVEAYYSHKGKPTVTDPIYIPRNIIPYCIYERCVGETFKKDIKYFDVYITIFSSFIDAKKYKEQLCA